MPIGTSLGLVSRRSRGVRGGRRDVCGGRRARRLVAVVGDHRGPGLGGAVRHDLGLADRLGWFAPVRWDVGVSIGCGS